MTPNDNERDNYMAPEGESTDETRLPDDDPSGNQGSSNYVEPHERIDSASGTRYLIGETLGEGGMAVVYQATDIELQRPVAVKRLRQEYAVQKEIRQRFFAEAEILAGLDHPGTTPVFGAGLLPEGDCFYAMKRVQGKTLRELMDERLPEDLLDRGNRAHFIEIFIRACQAVAAAHNQGVIHRDLKPANIMVDDLGVVYVMDWGLAKQLVEDEDDDQADSQRTRLGAVMGTPAYMSPEQASGHGAESDRQTDVFSLGVMLYEILTGVNPFRGTTAVESMKGVMYHEPDPPRTRNPRIDRTISAITMKALEKDPFRRYRSAHELAEDVRRYREYLPVLAIEPTRRERLANWSRRRPRSAAILATLVVVLIIGAFATAFQASVENARVARGYAVLDDIENRLAEIKPEIDGLLERRGLTGAVPELQVIENRLAELEAEYEMAEQERMAIGLAITGFTILSPESRARGVVRDAIWQGIREHVAAGDLYRARAEIQFALRYFEEGNLFGFSEADSEALEHELAKVEREIEAAERATAAAPGTAGGGK
jgi:serine/threonine protein kinase